MLSSVLRSERAVQVNIEIMRTFVRLREMLVGHVELARKRTALERKYDARFKVVFDAIRELVKPPEPNKKSVRLGLLPLGRKIILPATSIHTCFYATQWGVATWWAVQGSNLRPPD